MKIGTVALLTKLHLEMIGVIFSVMVRNGQQSCLHTLWDTVFKILIVLSIRSIVLDALSIVLTV